MATRSPTATLVHMMVADPLCEGAHSAEWHDDAVNTDITGQRAIVLEGQSRSTAPALQLSLPRINRNTNSDQRRVALVSDTKFVGFRAMFSACLAILNDHQAHLYGGVRQKA